MSTTRGFAESTFRAGRCPTADDAAPAVERAWTRQQLQAVAETDRRVQRHPQHMLARMALANHGRASDLEGVRAAVARAMGGHGDIHYIVAALHLAQLALAFPELLTATQRALLIAPLAAAEPAGDLPAGDLSHRGAGEAAEAMEAAGIAA